MKKQSQKRVDMYDIGEGLVLMNVITKNENGKMHRSRHTLELKEMVLPALCIYRSL